MKRIVLSFAVAIPIVFSATAQAGEGPKTVNARDTAHAAAIEVDDPRTMICVRKPITGSRTQTTKDCRTSAGWKAHRLEVQAAGRTINKS